MSQDTSLFNHSLIALPYSPQFSSARYLFNTLHNPSTNLDTTNSNGSTGP